MLISSGCCTNRKQSSCPEADALCSYCERLATTTCIFNVWVLEGELCADGEKGKRLGDVDGWRDVPQRVLLPVHLAADDREQCFAVYEHLDAILLYYLVKLPRLVDVLEVVRQPRAALVPHSYA